MENKQIHLSYNTDSFITGAGPNADEDYSESWLMFLKYALEIEYPGFTIYVNSSYKMKEYTLNIYGVSSEAYYEVEAQIDRTIETAYDQWAPAAPPTGLPT